MPAGVTRGRGPTAWRRPGRARRRSARTASVTPSATPPVECLSTAGRPADRRRSTVSPDSIIARVSASVSSSSRPREQARHEERTLASASEPSSPVRRSSARIEPPRCSSDARASSSVALARHDDSRRIVEAHAPNPIRSREAPPDEALDVDPEEVGDGGAQVAERSAGPDLVRAAGQPGRQQRGPLARVVGRRRRRVAAVVAGDEQDAAAERRDQLGQPTVERLDRRRVAGRGRCGARTSSRSRPGS